MQLLTKERMPARRKLPATISNLPSHTIRKDNNTTETYIGLKENDFKTRYRNHTHHSAMLDTETPPNSATTSGPSKKTTSSTLFPGAFSHHTRRTTAQVKDVISASKINS